MLRDRLVVTHHMVRLCWGGPLIKQVRPASSAGHKPAGACHLWGQVAGPVELCVQRESRPREAFAARYQPGQPLGELDAVAGRAGDFEMTEIPQWRCLQVRTWPENGEPVIRQRHGTRLRGFPP